MYIGNRGSSSIDFGAGGSLFWRATNSILQNAKLRFVVKKRSGTSLWGCWKHYGSCVFSPAALIENGQFLLTDGLLSNKSIPVGNLNCLITARDLPEFKQSGVPIDSKHSFVLLKVVSVSGLPITKSRWIVEVSQWSRVIPSSSP